MSYANQEDEDLGIYQDNGSESDVREEPPKEVKFRDPPKHEQTTASPSSKHRDKSGKSLTGLSEASEQEFNTSQSVMSGRAFSADPALGIKGILNHGRSEKSASYSQTSDSRSGRGVGSGAHRNHTNTPVTVCGFTPNIIREVEYIKRKCLTADTRRADAYSDQSLAEMFLHQNKPSPMTPLKAWKGFGGNIYFSPLTIERVASAATSIETVSDVQNPGSPLSDGKQKRVQTAAPDMTRPIHCDVPPRPAVKMDKRVVMNKSNKDVQEDIAWIRKTENIGSLKIMRGHGDRAKERKASTKSLMKGSVAHQLALKRREGNSQSQILISGGHYKVTNTVSPLLRATTQYSRSANRPTTNSPDISQLDRLPPLEQLRASLREMSAKSAGQGQRAESRSSVGITDINSIPTYVKLDRKYARELQRLREAAAAAAAAANR